MTGRRTPAPRSEALGTAQSERTGDAGSTHAVAASQYTTSALQSACPRCAFPGPHTQVLAQAPATHASAVASAVPGCAGSPSRTRWRRRGGHE